MIFKTILVVLMVLVVICLTVTIIMRVAYGKSMLAATPIIWGMVIWGGFLQIVGTAASILGLIPYTLYIALRRE